MADIAPKDFSTTAASNSTVGGVNIAEGMSAALLNNAIRAVCAVLANPDFGTGTNFKVDAIAESTAAAGVTIDGLLIKDGDLPGLDYISAESGFLTGDYRETSRDSADTGWLMANGETFGSASATADHASDSNEALFLHCWAKYSDTVCPVAGGRGASAAADWAANKAMGLPNRNNRMPVGAGDTYVNGETGGASTVTLTQEQLPNARLFMAANQSTSASSPSVSNSQQIVARNTSGDNVGYDFHGTATEATIGRTSPMGSGEAHNNMPPYFAVYYQIKL